MKPIELTKQFHSKHNNTVVGEGSEHWKIIYNFKIL